MVIHKIKIEPIFLWEIEKGNKTFEIRKNDRNYKVGDILSLMPYTNGRFLNGGSVEVRVSYILEGDDEETWNYGVRSGYVVMGIKLI